MTYVLMSPMERPKGWEFSAYFIYLKFDRDAKAFVSYADVHIIATY